MIVLDTSAFLAGFDPFSIKEEQVTTLEVQEEIRKNSIVWVRFKTAVENGKVKVKTTSEKFLKMVKASAITVGDSFFLSETDVHLLALALEFKTAGYKPQIVSDDYSIQNVATQMGIEFSALSTFGIRRLIKWIRYCPACHRKYAADYNQAKCTICGIELKRRPEKTPKNFKKTRKEEGCNVKSYAKKTLYFDKAGEQNTDTLLEIVGEYVEKERITNIIVASSTGETGAKVAKTFRGKNVVVVTHCYGFRESGKSELEERFKKEILANGAKIFTGTHALSSAERAARSTYDTLEPLELMANTLKVMGQGTKVCVEITLMAMDAGLVPADQDVVALGGTGNGADTALRIKPANSARFFELQIKEVLAKPSSF